MYNVFYSYTTLFLNRLDLRNDLSIYYKKNYMSSTQERIKELTRMFADYSNQIIINKELVIPI